MIEVLSVFGRDVRIRLRDATGESRGKPRLVTAAHLYSFVGDWAMFRDILIRRIRW